MLSTDESIFDRAGAWFLQSGIQQSNGGLARYYRSDLARYARVSTEITGYGVSTLLYLAQRSGDARYREAAGRAANFLTTTAWKPELAAFPFEHSDNCDQPEPLTFFFDTGIIIRGLLAAWRALGNRQFVDTAEAAGRAMIADFQRSSTIHPILHLPGKNPRSYELKWSASPGCYQLKAALAWRELWAISGDARFKYAWESAVEAALRNEADFLPGQADREKVMDRLHAYCYFLEALLSCAADSECAGALRRGMEKTAVYLKEIAPAFERSDVYAQLLRLRLYAAQQGVAPLDEQAAASEAAHAHEFFVASDDSREAGGVAFGRKGSTLLPFVNPVSTSFCIQALAMWDDHQSANPTADPLSLI